MWSCCPCPFHPFWHTLELNNSLKHKSIQFKQSFSIFPPTTVKHMQKYPIRVILRFSWRNNFFLSAFRVNVNFYSKSRIQCANDNRIPSLRLPLDEYVSRYIWHYGEYTQHPGREKWAVRNKNCIRLLTAITFCSASKQRLCNIAFIVYTNCTHSAKCECKWWNMRIIQSFQQEMFPLSTHPRRWIHGISFFVRWTFFECGKWNAQANAEPTWIHYGIGCICLLPIRWNQLYFSFHRFPLTAK